MDTEFEWPQVQPELAALGDLGQRQCPERTMFRISAEPSSRLNWPHSIVFRLRLAAFDVAPKRLIRRTYFVRWSIGTGPAQTSKDILPHFIERDYGPFMWTGVSKFALAEPVYPCEVRIG